MNTTKTSSTKKWITWGIVIALVAIPLIWGFSIANKCVEYETDIERYNEGMANVRGKVKNVLSGQGQAVSQYSDLVIASFEQANTSRYGESGSQAAFQWIKEQNPNISPEIFLKLQQAIEANWLDFEKSQNPAIDVTYNYKNYLRRMPNGFFAGIFGYPKIDLKKYEKAVTTKDARKAIDTREDDGVDIFPDKQKDKK